MLAVSREKLHEVAQHLAILHRSLTDSAGLLVRASPFTKVEAKSGFPFPVEDLTVYPAAIMAALTMLTGGEAIGYQGDVHIKILGRDAPQAQALDAPHSNGGHA